MMAAFCQNEQSVGWFFRQTTDAVRQTVFASGNTTLGERLGAVALSN